MGVFSTAEEAIDYYGKKRFQHGIGVTQPCQIRYVKYFEQILKGHVRAPTVKQLKSIEMHGIPNMKNKSCRPYLELVQVKGMTTLFSGKKLNTMKRYTCAALKSKTSLRSENHYIVKEPSIENFEEKSSNHESSEGDNFFKAADNRDRKGRWSTKVGMLQGSGVRKSTIHDKDRPSLFQFDHDDAHAEEKPKRRSNSMGKEVTPIEEEKFSANCEDKTFPTSDNSKDSGSHVGSRQTLHEDEEFKNFIKDKSEEAFGFDSEESEAFPTSLGSQIDKNENSIFKIGSFVVLRPNEVAALDIYNNMKV